MPMRYGYIRVSSADQNVDRQVFAMKNQKCDCLFIDRISGKNFKRPEYSMMIRRLRAGDLVFVTSIDRLGRNYNDIQEQWRILTKEKKVDICVLDMPLLDTRKEKNLMGTFVADLVLQILSFVAENERVNIHQRQAEGIAAAKKRGVRFGRPPAELPPEFKEAAEAWGRGELTQKAAAQKCGMPLSSFRYRLEAQP